MSGNTTSRKYRDWGPIIAAARDIVEGYDILITLRQLFYRLVAATLIANNPNDYKTLSKITAELRRGGEFPDLIDYTRAIHERRFYDGPGDALRQLADDYRLDRMDGQTHAIYLATEKRGLVAQLDTWFHADYGFPVLPLGGWTSVPFIDEVKAHVAAQREQDRKPVLLYAGDFDASGDTIDRVFQRHTPDCWDHIERVALNPDQITEYGLVRQRGKHRDSNAKAFVARHGDAALYDPAHPYVTEKGRRYLSPVQVEMEALDPNDMRALFTDAIAPFHDTSQYEAVLDTEAKHRKTLRRIASRYRR
jgi:hypothetical protein